MLLLKMLLVLLWCVAHGEAACSVCLANHNQNETSCLVHNSTYKYTLHRLSDITKRCKKQAIIRIYFTSVNQRLDMMNNVKETGFYGTPNGPPSIIKCLNAGIRFSDRKKSRILLSGLTFLNCGRARGTIRNAGTLVALYFKYVEYTLQNVKY